VTERTLAAGWTLLVAAGSQKQDKGKPLSVTGRERGMSEGMNERDKSQSGSERESESEKGDGEQQTEDRDGVRLCHEQRSVFDL